MGIELDDAEAAETSLQGGQRAVGYGVFPAEQHGEPAVIKDRVDGGGDPPQHGFGRPRAIHGGVRVDARFGGNGFPVPEFKLVRGFQNGFRAPGRAARIRNRGFQRDREDMEKAGAGRGIRQFGGQKTMYCG